MRYCIALRDERREELIYRAYMSEIIRLSFGVEKSLFEIMEEGNKPRIDKSADEIISYVVKNGGLEVSNEPS